MRQYIAFFKIRFLSCIQYRAAAVAGISTQLFFGIVYILVYYAFYKSNNVNTPMNFSALATYIWLQQSFLALINVRSKEKDLLLMIRDGNVAYELCRPGSLYIKWFIRIWANRLAQVTLRFFPVIIISLLLPKPYNFVLPDIITIIVFLIVLIFASLLVTAFVTLLHILSFYLLNAEGIISMFVTISELFLGSIVPILFLPKILQKISAILPFQYMADIPFRIFTQNIPINKFLPIITIQIIWFIGIMFFGIFISKKVLKKVVI